MSEEMRSLLKLSIALAVCSALSGCRPWTGNDTPMPIFATERSPVGKPGAAYDLKPLTFTGAYVDGIPEADFLKGPHQSTYSSKKQEIQEVYGESLREVLASSPDAPWRVDSRVIWVKTDLDIDWVTLPVSQLWVEVSVVEKQTGVTAHRAIFKANVNRPNYYEKPAVGLGRHVAGYLIGKVGVGE